jgi:PAS domain-containing protein
MKKTEKHALTPSTLRTRSEGLLKKQAGRLENPSAKDMKSLVHELGMHQIELEIQNEELRLAQEDLEAAGRKYTDLYNFAPVGYLTLDQKGIILEANLTAAQQLGGRKRLLIGKPLNSFLASSADSRVFLSIAPRRLGAGPKLSAK